ncbi:MAG: peptidase M22 [Ruminococcaceae bacterium]|nr:peptidase M22 [Oscillospiraceae bacterium]
MTECFVGIDTSNYTTSAAICTKDGEIVANLKLPLPVKAGECGLRQSDAVFAHVKNLPQLMERLAESLQGMKPVAVGVSATPRPLEGSYMPCFLSGIAAAQSFAAAAHIPLLRFSHQEGHIMAAAYSAGAMHLLDAERFAAFHVSGGTTEVLLATPHPRGFDIELFSATADINAGQAIDRIGVMLGLDFPCGKELEKLAEKNTKKIPKSRISVKDGYCNLSGLENMAAKLWQESGDAALVAAFTLQFIGDTLVAMTGELDARIPSLPIVYAGGVMSNRYLQARLGERKNTYFAEPQFSADNAAGIALLCRKQFLKI